MTLFIEILDDTRLRVCHDEHSIILTDTELPAYLQKRGRTADVVLLDVLHIQSKIFTRPVKDKKILNQVIAADMADYLLHDADAYQFAHHTHGGITWVSWIEQARLQTVKQRFATLAPRISALVSAPLLASMAFRHSIDDNRPLHIFEHVPLLYAVRGDETTVLRTEHAEAWLNSQSTKRQLFALDNPANRQRVFNAAHLKHLPNLWKNSTYTTPTVLPYGLWALLSLIIMALWTVNSYSDYQRAKSHNDSALAAQQQLLRQVFPNATTGDPYGRMTAEHQQLNQANAEKLSRLDKALRDTVLSVERLSVNLAAKRIILSGTVDDNVTKRLQEAGFVVNHTQTEVQLTWSP